jgi:hypothetical protein
MSHVEAELDTHQEKAAVTDSSLHDRVMQGVNTYQNSARVESTQQSAQDEQWQAGKIDFGTARELYGKSSKAEHPFTPAEIADAGALRAVELNKIFAGNESVLYGDRNPSPSNGEAPASVQDNAPTGLYEQAPSMTSLESVAEHRQEILVNLGQSGSAGVDQGGLPDCAFEAAVASVASSPQGQKDISNMIALNKDGSYTVTFPGASQHPIEVNSQDLANKKIDNSAGWANVLEAANLKLNPQAAGYGGGNGVALDRKYLEQLTGHFPLTAHLQQWIPAEQQAEEQIASGSNGAGDVQPPVEKLLEKALSSGNAVEAGGAAVGDPLESSHGYSVISLKDGQVTVRNPWGNENIDSVNHVKPRVGYTWQGVTNLGGGESRMPYDTFMRDLPELTFDRT